MSQRLIGSFLFSLPLTRLNLDLDFRTSEPNRPKLDFLVQLSGRDGDKLAVWPEC